VLNAHLPWMLPALLQFTRCLNAIWEPQARGPLLLVHKSTQTRALKS